MDLLIHQTAWTSSSSPNYSFNYNCSKTLTFILNLYPHFNTLLWARGPSYTLKTQCFYFKLLSLTSVPTFPFVSTLPTSYSSPLNSQHSSLSTMFSLQTLSPPIHPEHCLSAYYYIKAPLWPFHKYSPFSSDSLYLNSFLAWFSKPQPKPSFRKSHLILSF